MTSMERAAVRILPWLGGGLVVSLPLLLASTTEYPIAWSVVHLSGLTLFGLGASLHLAPLADGTWFPARTMTRFARLLASAAGVIVLVTGAVALVTLASAAALRFDPSLQFLQLLSALDIAWVVAAVLIGLQRGWNRAAAAAGGLVVGAVCVWTIARYLDRVRLDASGGWIVDGERLLTMVIVPDMVVALVAITVLIGGTVRLQRMEQPSAQS